MKVLVATEKPFAPIAIQGISDVVKQNGDEMTLLEKYTEKQQLLDAVKDADALIVRSDIVDAEVLAAAGQLKIVVRAGAGYDNIDLKTASEKGIVVMNTPGQNSNAVAELVFGLLLFAVRSQFNGKTGTELKGKTIGLMAFGAVAQNVARIAKGFDMEVMAYSPTNHPEKISKAGFRVAQTPEELFEQCDIVSLHIPSNPQTKESINYALLVEKERHPCQHGTQGNHQRSRPEKSNGRTYGPKILFRPESFRPRRLCLHIRHALFRSAEKNGCSDVRGQHQRRHRRSKADRSFSQDGRHDIPSEQIAEKGHRI